jgi:hypothetical protein
MASQAEVEGAEAIAGERISAALQHDSIWLILGHYLREKKEE